MSTSIRADRTGARRKSEIPERVLRALEAGEVETVNLMEWLAVDMCALAKSVACQSENGHLSDALRAAADRMRGLTLTMRLTAAGEVLSQKLTPESADFEEVATHRSDIVRQWACYAVNAASQKHGFQDKLRMTLRFAADRNMTVREAAWMALRPHVKMHLGVALPLLAETSTSADANLRRFAIEVTRPRSVWGTHLEPLKREPERAERLLDNVRHDGARYVQLSAGNWLNDASRTRPDWVERTSRRWGSDGDGRTAYIVKRGMRTIRRLAEAVAADPSQLRLGES